MKFFPGKNPNIDLLSEEAAKEKELSVSNMVPLKPDLLIGVSTRTPKISDEDVDILSHRFSSSGTKCCEICGVSLSEDFRHSLFLGKAWFNACGMCYYTENLNEINSVRTGSIIYFPYMSQARLNALLRAIWSVDYLRNIEPENQELEQMASSIASLNSSIVAQERLTDGYFSNSRTDIYVSLMGLLKDDEYKQRYKLFRSFRWLPDQSSFKEEMAFWSQAEYSRLHPEKTSGNITDFMSQYATNFSLKE
jgi:hypothetical protein